MPLTRAVKYENHGLTTLTNAIDDVQTTIEVDDASVLPVIAPGEHFYMVIATTFEREIVRGTDVTGSIVTVDRGVDDTIAVGRPGGTDVQVWFVKLILEDIREDFDNCLDAVEFEVGVATDIIVNNATKINDIDEQSDINAASAVINAQDITDLADDITDLQFQDMTDVTVAGSASFLAAQGVGASAANPMIKKSDIPSDNIGQTYFRHRILDGDWNKVSGDYDASVDMTGLVDGEYILMGTFHAGNPVVQLLNWSSPFGITINTAAPVSRIFNMIEDSLLTLGYHRNFMVPFTISAVTNVLVDFTYSRPATASSFNLKFVDLFAVRVG